jgi:hypothetical protein
MIASGGEEMLRKNRFLFFKSHLQTREVPRRKLAIFTSRGQIAKRDATQDKGESAWDRCSSGRALRVKGRRLGLGPAALKWYRCRIQGTSRQTGLLVTAKARYLNYDVDAFVINFRTMDRLLKVSIHFSLPPSHGTAGALLLQPPLRY